MCTLILCNLSLRQCNWKKSRNYSFWNLSLILILNLKSLVNTGPDVKESTIA